MQAHVVGAGDWGRGRGWSQSYLALSEALLASKLIWFETHITIVCVFLSAINPIGHQHQGH
jgi:hypothetical protein